jgi:hypothetical protein
LRGSFDFDSIDEYRDFLHKLFVRLNRGRRERFQEEQRVLRSLPERRLESCTRLEVSVGRASTIRVSNNTYSVASRLIGETLQVQLFADHLDLYYAQKRVDTVPRLRGKNRHLINYRHVIDQLRRKPGAFENYRYREEMFPGSCFRVAYDELKECHTQQVAAREYLKILVLAAKESEAAVAAALTQLCGRQPITAEAVEELVRVQLLPSPVTEVGVVAVDLACYDRLLTMEEVAYAM